MGQEGEGRSAGADLAGAVGCWCAAEAEPAGAAESQSPGRPSSRRQMLQSPSALLEMASLRLPDSDDYDLERRRAGAQQPAPPPGLSTSATGLVAFVGRSSADALLELVNGSAQELFGLASTSRPEFEEPFGELSGGGPAPFNASAGLSVEALAPADHYYRHSVAMSIVYFVAYCLVFVVGLIGNSFVIAVVYRSPRMRTVTNFFIVNLAVADVLVIVFCVPATLMSNIFVREYPLSIFFQSASFIFFFCCLPIAFDCEPNIRNDWRADRQRGACDCDMGKKKFHTSFC